MPKSFLDKNLEAPNESTLFACLFPGKFYFNKYCYHFKKQFAVSDGNKRNMSSFEKTVDFHLIFPYDFNELMLLLI